MKKSGESLTVKPKVNLSIPISVFQKWRVSVVMQFNGEKKKPKNHHQERALVYKTLKCRGGMLKIMMH